MPEKNGYAPGQFCWIEVATTDTTAAGRFYAALFGWQIQDTAAEGHGPYTMLRLGGREIGGMYTLLKEQTDQGVPPHWLSYIAVASADDAAAKARELGGNVIMGPLDVMDVGRMAVVGDPTGAIFCIWEAKQHQGMGVAGEVGTPCWFELATKDAARSGAFFSGLFGWKREEQDMGGTKYTMFRHGDGSIGGMIQMTGEWGDTPSHWMVYFAVADCDAACTKLEELGGKVCVPATDIPGVGRFAVVNDPQGAYFTVIALAG